MEGKLAIFDLGGVMFPSSDYFGAISAPYGLCPDEVRKDYIKYNVPLLEGYMSAEDYYDHFSRHFGVELKDDPFMRWTDTRLNGRLVDLVARLRHSGVRCVVGSNIFSPSWEKALESGIGDIFDALYGSHLMHASKPDPLFFKLILSNEGFEAEDTYFLDDMEENTASARALGISAITYLDGCDLSPLEALCC